MHEPGGEQMPIYDAAMRYKQEGVPLVVFGGKEYGMGSSATGRPRAPRCSASRPSSSRASSASTAATWSAWACCRCTFKDGATARASASTGDEVIDIVGLEELRAGMDLLMRIHRASGKTDELSVKCRVDTADEVEYYRNGGILHYVLREMARAA